MQDLTEFRISGTQPFCSPGIEAVDTLIEAYALVALVTMFDSQAEDEGLKTVNPQLTQQALKGIGTLIALATAQLEAAEGGAQ